MRVPIVESEGSVHVTTAVFVLGVRILPESPAVRTDPSALAVAVAPYAPTLKFFEVIIYHILSTT
jgi:hypothetical protein